MDEFERLDKAISLIPTDLVQRMMMALINQVPAEKKLIRESDFELYLSRLKEFFPNSTVPESTPIWVYRGVSSQEVANMETKDTFSLHILFTEKGIIAGPMGKLEAKAGLSVINYYSVTKVKKKKVGFEVTTGDGTRYVIRVHKDEIPAFKTFLDEICD